MATVRVLVLVAAFAAVEALKGVVRGGPPNPSQLAARIDARLEARWQAERIQPAPPADDAELLRRVFLDLTGRIPRPDDVHAYLADTATDKRRRLIERLLEEPRYAVHFAHVWRAELLPEIA